LINPHRPILMKKIRSFALLALLAAGLGSLSATTVIPPTFDQLVSRAELIFEGTVTHVHSQWLGEGAQRRIVTYVTFKIDDAMKGTPGASYTIRMLGGTVDGRTMEVTDSPKFKAGDHDVLFVEHNGQQFIPLVGIMHGRYHIERDQTGQEIVVDHDGQPLTDVANLGKEETNASGARAPLSLGQFKSAIRSNLQGSQAQQH
jgi:hypothetical protein